MTWKGIVMGEGQYDLIIELKAEIERLSTDFIPTHERRPEEGQRVDWIAPGGQQVNGGRIKGGLWFLPNGNMYCYYTPVAWRPARRN